jgi:oxygen-independent coproporphyrinogen-3 oxidase
MVLALAKELKMRKKEFENDTIKTLYFGGGTPSILEIADCQFLISEVYANYTVSDAPEITLEANPDDLSEDYLIKLSSIGINRLSIGIQSFFEDDLKIMNRAHNSDEAKECLTVALKYFDNISIDLIYGIPDSNPNDALAKQISNQKWKQNIEIALRFGVPHISSYALTVEPKTALKQLIENGQIAKPQDELTEAQFQILVETLESNGFIHYELSNFGKQNYFSKNNSAYWLGKKYIGIGPSAHSYDGISRSWNISNNTMYLKSLTKNILPNETEILSITDRYNEYIMTGLRTIWGVDLDEIQHKYGTYYVDNVLKQIQKFIDDDLLFLEKNVLKTTKKGKFLTDGIASDLFLVNP